MIVAPSMFVLGNAGPSFAVPGPIAFQVFRLTASGKCSSSGVPAFNCTTFHIRGTATVIGAVTFNVTGIYIDPRTQPVDNGSGGSATR
jgi:hypothetical protein